MELMNMRVLLVDPDDYVNHFRSIWGIKWTAHKIYDADIVVDRETGKILKSRYF